MKENILSVSAYLEHNPNATLKEYYEYVNKMQNDEHTRKSEAKKNFDDWLKSKIGKWFFVNFNDTSYMLCRYAGTDMSKRNTMAIEFIKDGYGNITTWKAQSTYDRHINYMWLNDLNPYAKENLPYYSQSSGVRWVKEVSQEFVDKIFNRFNVVSSFVNETLEEVSHISF